MEKNKLKDSLKKIRDIIDWFDRQEEVDVEVGLEKVREGAALIKESKARLKKVENEFEEVKKELEEEVDDESEDTAEKIDIIEPGGIPF